MAHLPAISRRPDKRAFREGHKRLRLILELLERGGMIVASKIVDVRPSQDGQRWRLYVEADGVTEAIDMPVHDLLRMLPVINSLSQKPDGMGRTLLSLRDHGTALLANGDLLLNLQTQEGWAVAFQVGEAQLASLRSSLASAATGQEAIKSRN